MNTKLSLIVATCLVASASYADSSSLQEALKNGKTKGTINIDAKSVNGPLYGKQDSEFALVSFDLGYKTDKFNGFSAAAGFRTSHALTEKNDNDFDSASTPRVVFHTGNLAYDNDFMNVTVGRQKLNLLWANEDYHEAFSATFKAPMKTDIQLVHSNRIASATTFMKMANFDKIVFDPYGSAVEADGVNIVDVKFKGIDNLVANAYYYDLTKVSNWYGLKVDYNKNGYGVTGQFTQTSEDDSTREDGTLYIAEARAKFFGTKFKVGYIGTDKTGGVGSMNTMDDDSGIPVAEGRHIFDADAQTFYIGAFKMINSKWWIAPKYAVTDYAGNKKQKELHLQTKYKFTKNFNVYAEYVNADGETSSDNFDFVKASFKYSL